LKKAKYCDLHEITVHRDKDEYSNGILFNHPNSFSLFPPAWQHTRPAIYSTFPQGNNGGSSHH